MRSSYCGLVTEAQMGQPVSLSAQEALELNVIDTIAADVPQLLRQLDGRSR